MIWLFSLSLLVLCVLIIAQEAAETSSSINSSVNSTVHNATDVVVPEALGHPGPLYELPIARNSTDDTIKHNNSTVETEPTVISVNTTMGHVSMDTHTCGVKNPDGTVRPLRIMTSSTAEYFPVFMNWLVYYHKICPNVANIYFICLDAAIEKMLPKHGFTCAHAFHVSLATALHDIWLVRTKLTHDLLNKGYDVLLTDSDALWLRNPFPIIEKHITSDVISSRGSFPDHISKKLGATLCMGFVYIRASPHTVKLWSEIAGLMAKQANPDDQREVNGVLSSHNLNYKKKLTYVGSQTYDTGHFTLNNYYYSITLLPHTLFRRICDQEKIGDVSSSVVAHCLSHQKAGHSKISTAAALGMWQLKEGWESEVLEGDLVAYLDRVSAPEVVREVRALTVQGVRRLHIQTNLRSNSTQRMATHAVPLRSLRGAHIAHGNTVVCLEYHKNKHLFNSSSQLNDDCWYVSTDAPDSSIRQFEELSSTHN